MDRRVRIRATTRARDVARPCERRLDARKALRVQALAPEPARHDVPAHRSHLRAAAQAARSGPEQASLPPPD